MPARIQKYCVGTDQTVPQTNGQLVRIALERLEEYIGKRLDPIHIIGGGTRNRLLNQLAADATGPVEATARELIEIYGVGIGVRELAIELSPQVRVNGLAPATVVEGSGMFLRDRVISSLTKYDIAFEESESTEALRDNWQTSRPSAR